MFIVMVGTEYTLWTKLVQLKSFITFKYQIINNKSIPVGSVLDCVTVVVVVSLREMEVAVSIHDDYYYYFKQQQQFIVMKKILLL